MRVFPSASVVDPDEVLTSSGGRYRVFTPYWRAWREAERRTVLHPPRIRLPDGVELGRLPDLGAGDSPARLRGGEREGRKRLSRFLDGPLASYEEGADDLAAGATSQAEPVPPLRLPLAARGGRARRGERGVRPPALLARLLPPVPGRASDDSAGGLPGATGGVAGRPGASRPGRKGARGTRSSTRACGSSPRRAGCTNRARLIVGSFLTKTLRLDWREGAAHFFDLLVDGDLASNVGNWQWVAGTGVDPRPNRILNPIRQARRFDPDGEYVRRHVPELSRRGWRRPCTSPGGSSVLPATTPSE